MATDTYLTFYIVLADEAMVNQWNASNPNGLMWAPSIAADHFHAPYQGYVPGTGTNVLAAPFSYSPVAKYTMEESREYPYPLHVAQFSVTSGGFWGFFGTTIHYHWLGRFVYKPPTVNTPQGDGSTPIHATAKRRWIEGFETPGRRTSPANDMPDAHCTTDASRHVGGRGLAIRRNYDAYVTYYTRSFYPTEVPMYARSGWERFYFRIRHLPATTVQFWKTGGYNHATVDGHGLGLTATGQLALFTWNGTTVWTLVGTVGDPLEVWTGRADHDAWHRVDVVYDLNNSTYKVYLDGKLKSIAGGVTLPPPPAAQFGVLNSSLGAMQPADDSTLELDVDDWFNCELPAVFNGLDFTNGSRMVHVRVTGFHAHHDAAAWPGDVRTLLQEGSLQSVVLSSTTSGGVVAVTTNAELTVHGDPKSIGAAALLVQATANWSGAALDPSLGYGLAGGPPVLGPPHPAHVVPMNDVGLLYSAQAGTVAPLPDIHPLELQYVKGADAVLHTLQSLSAQVELLGQWNRCDASAAGTDATGRAVVWAWVDKDGPAVDSPYATGPQTAEAYKSYFFSLIGKTEGSDASDWVAVLTASGIPTGLAADVPPTTAMPHYALTQQMGAGGVRGRLFLPTSSKDSLGYYSHPFDVLADAPADAPAPVDPEADPTVVAGPQSDSTGPHNYPYPQTVWAKRGLAPPLAPYAVYGGTYTGNGTGQDLAAFPAPIHWVFTRPLTGTSGGVWWFSPGLSAHRDGQQGSDSTGIQLVEQDPTFVASAAENTPQERYRVRVTGSHLASNQNAMTYQYIAVSDPGMRFHTGMGIAQRDTAGARTLPLLDSAFTPEWAFVWVELAGLGSGSGFYARGPGNAAGVITGFSPVNKITNALTLNAGSLTTDDGLFNITPAASIMLMLARQDDGSGATGMHGAVAIGTWTGDGAASRTIMFRQSGRRPLFAVVFSETSIGAWRDPSHTGTTSQSGNGTSLASTGITAGSIDGMTVGTALNADGVIYNYYVLLADVTACNNGWGCNGTYVPVDPASPPAPPYPPQPNVPPPPVEPGEPGEPEPEPGEPGEPPGDDTDFSVECAPWSTYLINVALSRIGVGKQLADAATDTSEEAYKGRLIYAVTVEAVLRDFPWGFATRYADLVLVAGSPATPVNKDWTYSYRAPADMVHARRIVGQAGEQRRYDHKPPHFRVGSDATGYLIYAHAATSPGIPVQLEYTSRMPCPAHEGDPLFRDALIWKLAEGLALPLARDADKANYARAQYDVAIRAAKTVAANEEQKDPNTGDAPWIRDR